MSITMVALGDILPNRYRNMKHYEIQEDKIAALLQSYENSGFWDGSIQARPHHAKPGKFEIAFGHHRVEAARRLVKTKPEFGTLGLVVAPRSNADMLRMMADENHADFRHDMLITVETIAATIDAYAAGEIELEPVAEDHVRKSDIYHLADARRYTLGTVARFLGWVQQDGQPTRNCRTAFEAYQRRAGTTDAIKKLPTQKRSEVAVEQIITAQKVAEEEATKKGYTPAKVVKAGQVAASQMADVIEQQSGFDARDMAVNIGKKVVAEAKPKKVPPIEIYTDRIIKYCDTAEPYAKVLAQCRQLVPYIDDLDSVRARKLAKALENMLERSASGVQAIARALRSGNPGRMVKLLEESKTGDAA